jgi:prophage regulatory protein
METKVEAAQIRAVRLPTVCNVLGASKSSVWRWVREDPSFPKPFKLGPQLTVWDETEVLHWLDAKRAVRTAAQAVQ